MSQSQQNSEEDSTLENLTELTTVLGEYATSPVHEKSKSAWLSVLPLLLIISLLVAFGSGGYALFQRSNISKIQSDLSALQGQTEKIATTVSFVLTNDAKAWDSMDAQLNQLNSQWADIQTSITELNAEEERRELGSAIQEFKKFKPRLIDFLNNAGKEPVDEQDLKTAQTKVAGIINRAQKLGAQVNNIKTDYVTTHEPILNLLNIVCLAASVLGLLLALIISKQFIVAKRGRGQEMRQLSTLVEDLQSEAERQRHAAQEQVAAARRVNEANQAAILRLMNELQNLAEGDLTQQATVTEDITGAIADSVNYTVEELRTLVSQVQAATMQVSKTTAVVESTSTELLASSDEQLHEIRETGQSILDVAKRINAVSSQAQQSAQVATQSLDAADKGLSAVQNAIGGMNTIRDQIQDTSKRIKRLVESSQEIGEITDLIADITEQTNVLALNAAIQAASAGEAGRGFSVVAEEVQRLAERSAGATRQIASLVKAIQEDMQDAMAAMERSTQGVVEGARLSDQTGTAFSEINAVAKKLAGLIQKISEQAENEANVANSVADNIQHIFAVTEQTADGTRSTAQQVRELARVANQLERSVARFKIS